MGNTTAQSPREPDDLYKEFVQGIFDQVCQCQIISMNRIE